MAQNGQKYVCRVVCELLSIPKSSWYRLVPKHCFLIEKTYNLIIYPWAHFPVVLASAGRTDRLGRMLVFPIISRCFIWFAISLYSGTQENNGFACAPNTCSNRTGFASTPYWYRTYGVFFVYSVLFALSRIGGIENALMRRMRSVATYLHCCVDRGATKRRQPRHVRFTTRSKGRRVFSNRPSCFHWLSSGTVKRITDDRTQLVMATARRKPTNQKQ